MEGNGSAGYRSFTVAALCTVAMLAATAAAGCSGSRSHPEVRIALTAPTEGSLVRVSTVKVFGTVDPGSAHVRIGGHRVHVSHGHFAHWVTLPRGASRISIAATAAGYAPTAMSVALHSLPSAPPLATAQRAGRRARAAARAASAPLAPPAARGYPAVVRDNLLRTCRAAAGGSSTADARCGCTVAYLEAHISEPTIIEWERAFFRGEATLPGWAREAAIVCRRA